MIRLNNVRSSSSFCFFLRGRVYKSRPDPRTLSQHNRKRCSSYSRFDPHPCSAALDVFRDLRIAFLQANLGQRGLSDRLLNIHREGGGGGGGGEGEGGGVLLLYTYSIYLGSSVVHIDERGVLQCAMHPALARCERSSSDSEPRRHCK